MSQAAFYRGVEHAQRALAAAPAEPIARAAAAAAALDALVAITPDATVRACRDGCAHCCHHPVGVTLPEALRLAAAIDEQPGAVRDDLRAAIAAGAAATQATPWADLARLACPLLRAQRCAVYAARPLPCRAWVSSDATACAEGRAELAFDRAAFLHGLGAAQALGGDDEPRELRSALAAVLAAGADQAAAARAFAAARRSGS